MMSEDHHLNSGWRPSCLYLHISLCLPSRITFRLQTEQNRRLPTTLSGGVAFLLCSGWAFVACGAKTLLFTDQTRYLPPLLPYHATPPYAPSYLALLLNHTHVRSMYTFFVPISLVFMTWWRKNTTHGEWWREKAGTEEQVTSLPAT